MRLIRKGFNFSDEELREAIEMARDRGKKTYITVNNLIDTKEIDAARAFLEKLSKMGPDGIIVQDFAVVSLVNQMKLPLEMHSSVMMNVHNLKFVEAVKREGITRVVHVQEQHPGGDQMDKEARRYRDRVLHPRGHVCGPWRPVLLLLHALRHELQPRPLPEALPMVVFAASQ
jgi:glycerol-3-phosphate responsive antiterminator